MRRLRAIGILAAVLALSAVGASAASAALPEYGRCTKVPSGGKYTNGACTTPAKTAKAGIWEFTPGAAKAKFTGTDTVVKGVAVTLETVGKTQLKCAAGGVSGEYTGGKSSTATAKFTGCAAPALGLKCKSSPIAAEGELTTEELEGELGFIVAPKPGVAAKVGLDLKAKAPGKVYAKFECGANPAPVHGTVEGSVIASFQPFGTTKTEVHVIFKQKAGKQIPESFEGGAKDVLTTTLLLGTEKREEQSGLGKVVNVKNEEALVLKTK
jgi:hypothetical protein